MSIHSPQISHPIMKFTADVMLGSLAKQLQFAGFDCSYFSHIKDQNLIRHAQNESRGLLTRDRELHQNCVELSESLYIQFQKTKKANDSSN